MAQLKEYKLVSKAFVSERPGAPMRMYPIGKSIFAPLDGPGALPPKQEYAVLVEGEAEKPAAKESTVAAGRSRAAKNEGEAEKPAE